MIYCNNFVANLRYQHHVLHNKMKHLEVDLHFIRNFVERKELVVSHIHVADQIADIFTKALPKVAFHRNLYKMGVESLTTKLEGAI
ncbi:retrovirus-related pol polyprotein from transposon tnt 1-94 [Gossypium australe]|uniref:Retrovirus-related pol polyprotein from transposon tnt 1-94 n=1 Tax=Gossypium australe TaxID=47621 RepID=A0A5B6WTE2_9ROSI|nr:retrovirus-related pol polyprotein from transposon tnt 1-94 [Gossypium australe]